MMFVPASENMASNDVCTILANKKLENKQLRLMFVPASKCLPKCLQNVCTSFMALRGWCVCGRPKRALRLARAGGRYLYARALVHLWGGGASESPRRHYWTPAALGVAPGANINYSCSGESSCCQATGCRRNSAS